MRDAHATFHSVDCKRQILIVEDVEINREALMAALESDYTVLVAETGEDALRIIENHKRTLSVVLLDLILPSMPGQEVLRVIKANPEY